MGHFKRAATRFAVIISIAQAYLSLGLTWGRITSKEARILKKEFEILARRYNNDGFSEQTAKCIVDFNVAITDKAKGRADQISQESELLAIFEDFVNA